MLTGVSLKLKNNTPLTPRHQTRERREREEFIDIIYLHSNRKGILRKYKHEII
jgi:hypothetical protein